MRDLTLNDLDDASGPGISGDDARQELARVADRRQRIAQLVSEHREKLIFLLIRLFKLPALTLQCLVRLPALRDVAGGAKPLLDLAIVIEQRDCPREGPSNGTVGADHAVLELEHALVADRFLNRLYDVRAVRLQDISAEPGAAGLRLVDDETATVELTHLGPVGVHPIDDIGGGAYECTEALLALSTQSRELEDRSHTGEQLAGMEWLDDIVIGAGAQSFDSRFF